jgi:methylmalonyl-CoA mutase N-terminal domain/subunit
MAGSYYVEWLTNELEKKAREIMDRIEDMGGAVAAIESGYMQTEIQEAAVRYQQEIERGERVIVGVNKFTEGGDQPPTIFRVNTEVRDQQVRKLQQLRRERDQAAVEASLRRLREAAQGTENLMPPILDAVKAYATLGEICGVLREVFGDYRAPTAV